MKRMLVTVVSGCLVLVAASALVAAPPQGRAGEIDPARVWVQNRSAADAVAVSIEAVSLNTPMPVQLAGTSSVTVSEMAPIRHARQPWEYQVLTVSPSQDVAAVLTAAGRDGWEAISLQAPTATGLRVILKRPR
ncbi:MAG: hypothetical protein ABL986_03285 [Vicinamibacterales bacterium]